MNKKKSIPALKDATRKMDDIKQFLYAFLGKQKQTPIYDVNQIMGKNKQARFKCELRVEGYNYVAIGNSTNKKDAQGNAALDFCQFLVRIGSMNQNDLPKVTHTASIEPTGMNQEGGGQVARPSYNSNLPRGLVAPHQSMGLSFNEDNSRQILPYKRGAPESYMQHIRDMANRKMIEEAEDTDTNAEIHGFWTIDNAKSRLHQYLQSNKINIDYKYNSTGPDNNRSFFAEMSFYVPQIRQKIHANEIGANKQIASKACALSLVRQLFHSGAIEAFTGEKKKKERPKTAPFLVELSDELKQKLSEVCEAFQLAPTNINLNSPEPVSLVPPSKTNLFPAVPKYPGMPIAWCPPTVNWNPWIGCNIDEGPLANMSLEDMSQELYNNYMEQVNNDKVYQTNLKDREHLPVH